MDERIFYREALRFVKEKHKGQFRAGRVPSWHHLERVSGLLRFALEKNKEGNENKRAIIATAALGHDVLEDTDASEKEVRKIFGEDGYKIIKGMTNRWGDKYKKPYIRQVITSEEAVRIVKLSDLYENYISVAYNLRRLGLKWTRSYFLPIVTPMLAALKKTKFRSYRKTAADLILLADFAALFLEIEMKSFKKK